MNTNLFFVVVYLIVACFCYITWRKYKDKDFLYAFLLAIPAILNRILKNFPENFIYLSSKLKSVTDIIFFCFWILAVLIGIKLLVRGLMKK